MTIALCCLLVFALAMLLGYPTSEQRRRVVDALRAGPIPGRDLPLPSAVRYVVLHRMEVDGLIESEGDPGGGRIYRLPRAGSVRA